MQREPAKGRQLPNSYHPAGWGGGGVLLILWHSSFLDLREVQYSTQGPQDLWKIVFLTLVTLPNCSVPPLHDLLPHILPLSSLHSPGEVTHSHEVTADSSVYDGTSHLSLELYMPFNSYPFQICSLPITSVPLYQDQTLSSLQAPVTSPASICVYLHHLGVCFQVKWTI